MQVLSSMSICAFSTSLIALLLPESLDGRQLFLYQHAGVTLEDSTITGRFGVGGEVNATPPQVHRVRRNRMSLPLGVTSRLAILLPTTPTPVIFGLACPVSHVVAPLKLMGHSIAHSTLISLTHILVND